MNKQELIEYLIERPSYLKESQSKYISNKFGLALEFVKECFKEAKEKSGIVSTNRKKVKGSSKLLDVLNQHNLPLDQVKRLVQYGPVENPMFSITPTEEWLNGDKDSFLNKLKESIIDYIPPIFIPKNTEHKDCVAILNLHDAHIDKLLLKDEVGKNSSLEKNIEVFEDAFIKLLSQSIIYNPEYIIFIVGSDFYNTNDANPTTKKGTLQDVLPDWKSSFIEGYKCIRRCIDFAKQYSKVIITVVPGNHDADKIFHLGQMLEITYEKDPYVLLDNSSKPRKYFHWGSNLIGFGHGDSEKKFITTLPATMMIENKEVMPQIFHCHFYLGDIHHKVDHQFKKTEDLKGCTVTFLRALSDIGRWEYKEGYVGIPKTAESFIHHKEKGLIANLQVHI